MITQEPPSKKRNYSIVDEDLLQNKQNRRIFRAAAYSMGLGVGFMLLLPILPDIEDSVKDARMEEIFHQIAFTLISYSVAISLGFFFLREHIGLVRFLLNWVLIPTAAIYFLTDAYNVITG